MRNIDDKYEDTDLISVNGYEHNTKYVEFSENFLKNNPNYIYIPEDETRQNADALICYLDGKILRNVMNANVRLGYAIIKYRGLEYKVHGKIQLFNMNPDCKSARPKDCPLTNKE